MSAAVAPASSPSTPEPSRRSPRSRLWLYFGVLLVAVSATRAITGAGSITAEVTLRAALIAAIPIALAGLGGLWSERAGVVNIGLEGMMIMGTLGAGFFGYHYGIWAGLLGAAALGAIAGTLHALATVIFGVDHIVSGVAINIIAAGVAGFLAEAMFSGLPGGGPTQSPSLDRPTTITVPGVSTAMRDLGGQDWFLVSDAANLVASLTRSVSVFTLVALGLIAGTAWLLWKTPFGLRLRSCGESPSAAESLGVNVYFYKFVAVTVSGALAGTGGAYLAIVASSGYQNGQTLGLGYIGLAAMIFGNWRPAGLFLGALLFGYAYAARLIRGGESVHALLLLIAVALVVLAVWQLRKGVSVGGLAAAAVSALAFWVYFATDTVPSDFTEMTPFVATLLVLALFSQKLRMPAADGKVYRRGSAG